MIRRFNSTGRHKLPHGLFAIVLEPGQVRNFSATFSLSEYKFPVESRLYFEAVSSGSGIVARFPWGTVAQPQPPEDRSLIDLPGESVEFAFKVVDESDKVGRILGIAKGIRLKSGGSGPGTGRQSLLPVNPVPNMEQQIWRVSFANDTPWLEVNANIPEIMLRAQGDPQFVSLVYPAVVREILTEALIMRELSDPTDQGWEGRWLSFGMRFHPDQEAPPESDDADSRLRRAWIEQAVRGFCRHYAVRDRLDATPTTASEGS